ncbi:thioesterase II family protein [Nocardia sp. NPDC051570]|uniref:thioesterase II family protein n=1 Tax=Nocardia sp. NPDC051570 TaxID=3364324 RepID=UPI0037BE16E0
MTSISRDPGLWLRHFNETGGDGPRLICFPHAGGSATYYFPVARTLSPGIEVVAVQYPGRQERRGEPCVDDIGRLADHIVDALGSPSERPTALFGHSMGATIAFEVARRLERADAGPVALFASGRRAPSCVREENVHLRDDGSVLAELQRLGGTNATLLADNDIRTMILPAMRGDYRAIETYRWEPGPPLRCPIVALVGDVDPQVSTAEAQAWAEHTAAEFTLRTYQGGHFYLDVHAASVLREITDRLTPVR